MAMEALTVACRKPTMRTVSSTYNQHRNNRAGLNSGKQVCGSGIRSSFFPTIVWRIVKLEA